MSTMIYGVHVLMRNRTFLCTGTGLILPTLSYRPYLTRALSTQTKLILTFDKHDKGIFHVMAFRISQLCFGTEKQFEQRSNLTSRTRSRTRRICRFSSLYMNMFFVLNFQRRFNFLLNWLKMQIVTVYGKMAHTCRRAADDVGA